VSFEATPDHHRAGKKQANGKIPAIYANVQGKAGQALGAGHCASPLIESVVHIANPPGVTAPQAGSDRNDERSVEWLNNRYAAFQIVASSPWREAGAARTTIVGASMVTRLAGGGQTERRNGFFARLSSRILATNA